MMETDILTRFWASSPVHLRPEEEAGPRRVWGQSGALGGEDGKAAGEGGNARMVDT